MVKKASKVPVQNEPAALSHQPFAALAKLRGPAPASEAPVPASSSVGEPPKSSLGDKLVVQREKKGRGGKTVTRVTGFSVNHGELEALAHDLKKSLGCGASVEGHDIFLQGDQTKRVAQLLTSRGAKRVVIGN